MRPLDFLQTLIDIARAAALGNVTGDIFKAVFNLAFRTFARGRGCRQKKTALTAFPVSQTALGTDIPYKSALGRVATVGTHRFFVFVLHVSPLLF
jgi:hypothetical protein